ncbi:hypothetical protein GF373_14655 [bacterium]|nr:hypothetical protein [bacterium]
MCYRKSVSLALLPLIVQATLFLSWHFTSSSFLIHLTGGLVVGTVLCLGYGLACMRVFLRQAFTFSTTIPSHKRKVFFVCLLIFINAPISGLYAYWIHHTPNSHTILFINQGFFPMEDIRLTQTQGEQWYISSVPPAHDRTVRLPFPKNESVYYRLRMGDRIETGRLFERPAFMPKGKTTITMEKTGEFIIRLPKTK